MKELYTTPSVTVYSIASCSDLANSFHLNQLLGLPTGSNNYTSNESSGLEYPLRNY